MSESQTRHIIEERLPLSECMLWQLQREFYQQSGPAAWTTGLVPHYITNNTTIAKAVFAVFKTYITELTLSWRPDRPTFNPDEPLYILEPGAGTGRFAFNFLQLLKACRELEPFCRFKRIVYILADLAPGNIAFWQQHPQLAALAQEGLVDFAVFDAEKDHSLQLLQSQVELSAQSCRNPLITIGNYLFDTLRTDAFHLEAKKLSESLITIYTPQESDLQTERYNYLNILRHEYSRREVTFPRYRNPRWNALLEQLSTANGSTGFSLPVGGLSLIDSLLQLSHGRLLFLTADKAFCRLSDFVELDDPEPIIHGSFSLTVNFYALSQYISLCGGCSWLSSSPEHLLNHLLMLRDPLLPNPRNVLMAGQEQLEDFSPCDVVMLGQHLNELYKPQAQEKASQPPIEAILQIIRMSHYDPGAAYPLLEPLINQIETQSPALQREAMQTIDKVWHSYFHVPSLNDLPFELGRLAYRLDYYPEAIFYYQQSLNLFGPHRMTYFNMGLVSYAQEDYQTALDYFEQALKLSADYTIAREWQAKTKKLLTETIQ